MTAHLPVQTASRSRAGQAVGVLTDDDVLGTAVVGAAAGPPDGIAADEVVAAPADASAAPGSPWELIAGLVTLCSALAAEALRRDGRALRPWKGRQRILRRSASGSERADAEGRVRGRVSNAWNRSSTPTSVQTADSEQRGTCWLCRSLRTQAWLPGALAQ